MNEGVVFEPAAGAETAEVENERFLTLTRRLHGLAMRLREAEEALRMREREIGELRAGLQETMRKVDEVKAESASLSEALEALRKEVEALKVGRGT